MTKSDIVYVDDVPSDLMTLAAAVGVQDRIRPFETPVRDPEAPQVAAAANLWVFDFFNDEQQRLAPSLEGVASNGLSVFQQLRRMVGDARPLAVLVSAHLEQAIGAAVPLRRRHIVASELGVDWIAPKESADVSCIDEIVTLADAVAAIREVGAKLKNAEAQDYAEVLSVEVLKLSNANPWWVAAVRAVARWRAPNWIDELDMERQSAPNLTLDPIARPARDLVVWLLRQALPYPSFLVRRAHVALALGVTPACLGAALEAKAEVALLLEESKYTGVLSTFDGPRWWAAGIDSLVWKLPTDKTERADQLKKLFGAVPFEPLDLEDPVVVSDPDLVETEEIAQAKACVRASDEHFPSQAGPAWVKIVDARQEAALRRKVRLEDQADLTDAE